jgi:CSLREA domain-containing protein
MCTQRTALTPLCLPIRTLLGSTLIVIVLILCLPATPLAGSKQHALIVDTTEDELDDGGNDCSLREAIQAANTDSPVDGCPAGEGDDAILLPAGRYLLTLSGAGEDANATGDLDIITGTVIIMGPGPEHAVVDGNQLDRVLHVHDGATVEIHGIQIAHGSAPADLGEERRAGGGIYNAGALLLSYSTVISNTAGGADAPLVDGGHGGGIYNLGTLTLDHTSIVANAAGGGGGGDPFLGFPDGGQGGNGGGVYNHGALILSAGAVRDNMAGGGGSGEAGGSGGWGGGICNSGTLTLIDGAIENNQAGGGGVGSVGGGDGGLGGGIYNSSVLTLSGGVIMNNTCGAGGDGLRSNGAGGHGGEGGGIYNAATMVVTGTVVLGNVSGRGGGGSIGNDGGDGGGIYNGGTLALAHSSIAGNATGHASGGFWTAGVGGAGGGICNTGAVELSRSTISGNATGSGAWAYYGGGTDGGRGGGIDNSGIMTLTTSTVSGNTTANGGEGGNAGHGGGAYNAGTLTVRNSTIAHNAAGSSEADGIAGGIYTQGALVVMNTILAGNVDTTGPCDCHQETAPPLSLGYNLVQSRGTCVFAATADLTGTAPLLGTLRDYGGDTFTHPLLFGSPAIDQGSCRDSHTDQRGFLRPIDWTAIPNADDGCDIGAFESSVHRFQFYLPLTMRQV